VLWLGSSTTYGAPKSRGRASGGGLPDLQLRDERVQVASGEGPREGQSDLLAVALEVVQAVARSSTSFGVRSLRWTAER
jgi:hypothetical protein